MYDRTMIHRARAQTKPIAIKRCLSIVSLIILSHARRSPYPFTLINTDTSPARINDYIDSCLKSNNYTIVVINHRSVVFNRSCVTSIVNPHASGFKLNIFIDRENPENTMARGWIIRASAAHNPIENAIMNRLGALVKKIIM